jgi:hypothetical protein
LFFFCLKRCRHASISNYFGDDSVPNCSQSCDVCKHPDKVKKMLDSYKRGASTFSASKFSLNFNTLRCDMDSSDLYEGGRGSKRKRGGAFDDYDDSDGDDSPSSKDPNAYDSKMANFRFKLIKSEFDKRRSGAGCEDFKNNELSEEEKQLAKTTRLQDPLNSKIQNLGLKSRTNWHTKISQSLKSNTNSSDSLACDIEIDDLSIKLELEAFEKAKNLITYQASCMKKISEINKATKSGLSFFKLYKKNLEEETIAKTLEHESEHQTEAKTTASLDTKIPEISLGFQSALNLFGDSSKANKLSKTESLKKELDLINSTKLGLKTELTYSEVVKNESSLGFKKASDAINTEFNDKSPKIELVKRTQSSFKPPTLKKEIELVELDESNLEFKEINTRKEEKPKINNDQKIKETKFLDLNQISAIVVKELTQLYKGHKFATKDLFKIAARQISHHLLRKKFSNENEALNEIKKIIERLKMINGQLKSQSDYEFIFN